MKALIALFVTLLAWPLHGGPREEILVEEALRIPGPHGRYTIATAVVRPSGPGPFAAIVLNHGVPVSAEARAHESAAMLRPAAEALARRGYVVVMPLRRGFGATGGGFAESAGSCSAPDYFRGEAAAAEDIMAAYDYARRLPYVDGARMVLAGQSAGAVAALFAAGTRAPDGLLAVLAFAPGRGGDPIRHPGVPCAVEPLAAVFAELGRRVRVPVLFHYAANDLFFNPSTSGLWFKRFRAGGARGEYVLQPPFGGNGHYIFSDGSGARLWLPTVERFLRGALEPRKLKLHTEA